MQTPVAEGYAIAIGQHTDVRGDQARRDFLGRNESGAMHAVQDAPPLDQRVDAARILDVGRIGGARASADQQKVGREPPLNEQRQRLDQVFPALALVEEAELSKYQVARADAPPGPRAVSVVARGEARRDVAANRNTDEWGGQMATCKPCVVLAVSQYRAVRPARKGEYCLPAQRARLWEEVRNPKIVECDDNRRFPLPSGPRRQQVDTRVHAVGCRLVLDVKHIKLKRSGHLPERVPDAPAPVGHDAMNPQGVQYFLLTGGRPLAGDDVHIVAGRSQGPAKRAGVVSDAALIRWVLACDQSNPHVGRFPTICAPGLSPVPRTWE